MNNIKLTEYSHVAGCGFKISPAVLDSILKTSRDVIEYPKLLVGNSTKNDAATFNLGNGTSVLSTTDFFMPIVDDPFNFGRIAATNALSDIYAMGGKPLMAIAILRWPIKTLAPEIASEVIDGGRSVCETAVIPLAGAQTSGGLLAIIKKDSVSKFLEITSSADLSLSPIGYTCKRKDKLIKAI